MRSLAPVISISGKRSLCLLLLFFSLGASVLANPSSDLALVEKVAAWQLQNPCSFDILWRAPSASEAQDVRLGWDGRILRRRTAKASSPEGSDLPSSWTYLTHREAGNLAFDDLP